jgi:general stress protein 26
MDIEDAKSFMKKVEAGILATTDGFRVGSRPMAGWAWMHNELWCATFASSEKVEQLNEVPYAEYCFLSDEHEHLRIAGTCVVSEKIDDKLALYEAVPELKEHIADPQSDEYVVLRLKPERIRFMDKNQTGYEYIELK